MQSTTSAIPDARVVDLEPLRTETGTAVPQDSVHYVPPDADGHPTADARPSLPTVGSGTSYTAPGGDAPYAAGGSGSFRQPSGTTGATAPTSDSAAGAGGFQGDVALPQAEAVGHLPTAEERVGGTGTQSASAAYGMQQTGTTSSSHFKSGSYSYSTQAQSGSAYGGAGVAVPVGDVSDTAAGDAFMSSAAAPAAPTDVDTLAAPGATSYHMGSMTFKTPGVDGEPLAAGTPQDTGTAAGVTDQGLPTADAAGGTSAAGTTFGDGGGTSAGAALGIGSGIAAGAGLLAYSASSGRKDTTATDTSALQYGAGSASFRSDAAAADVGGLSTGGASFKRDTTTGPHCRCARGNENACCNRGTYRLLACRQTDNRMQCCRCWQPRNRQWQLQRLHGGAPRRGRLLGRQRQLQGHPRHHGRHCAAGRRRSPCGHHTRRQDARPRRRDARRHGGARRKHGAARGRRIRRRLARRPQL